MSSNDITAIKRIMVVYGTRPEAIKVAPLIKRMYEDQKFEVIPVVTGQHRSMLDQVNAVFGIEPARDVDVFEPGQSLNVLSSKIFRSLDSVYADIQPDAVVLQGDTTTVMAAAVAAFYRGIPVVHLEAGLRSHDLFSPFPEEANRKIVSQVSSLHLAPTQTSRENLVRENVDSSSIVVTGNTVVDALQYAINCDFTWSDPKLAELAESDNKIILVTAHRRENWGKAMEGVGEALRMVSKRYPNARIVLPAHKNPVVREAILPKLEDCANVFTFEPLPYLEFAKLIEASNIVLTDSGGIQEEAPSLGKPVLVMRENTERPEAVDAGTVELIGTDRDRIFDSVGKLMDDDGEYRRMAKAVNPYGDGIAAERSLGAIAELLGVGRRLEDFNPNS